MIDIWNAIKSIFVNDAHNIISKRGKEILAEQQQKEMKQTLVDWLSEIDKHRNITIEEWQQAKKKENEIIDESYQEGYQNGHEAAMNYTDLRKCKCGLAQIGGFTCARTDCDQNVTYGDNK